MKLEILKQLIQSNSAKSYQNAFQLKLYKILVKVLVFVKKIYEQPNEMAFRTYSFVSIIAFIQFKAKHQSRIQFATKNYHH